MFTTVAVLLLTALAWWVRKVRLRRGQDRLIYSRAKNPGFDNINYGEVERDATSSRKLPPSDYEVPHPTQRYINVPAAHNIRDSFTGSSGSGVYSYVLVRNTASSLYDSHFLQSSESVDLPTIVAAETSEEVTNGRRMTNYVLLQNH